MLPHAGLFITTNRTNSPLIILIVQLDKLKRPPISKLDRKRTRCGDRIHCSLMVLQQGAAIFPPLLLSVLPRKHQRCFIWMGQDPSHRVSQPQNLPASLVLPSNGAEVLLEDHMPSEERLK